MKKKPYYIIREKGGDKSKLYAEEVYGYIRRVRDETGAKYYVGVHEDDGYYNWSVTDLNSGAQINTGHYDDYFRYADITNETLLKCVCRLSEERTKPGREDYYQSLRERHAELVSEAERKGRSKDENE